MANIEKKLQIVIEAQNKATTQLQSLSGKLSEVEDKTKKSSAMFKKFGVAALAAGAVAGVALYKGLQSVVRSAAESEKAVADLNAVLTATKSAAGISSEEAQRLATSLQKVTTYSDETILSAETMILQFKSIGKDVFPEVTEMALNMATRFGKDAKSAALALGRALEDPSKAAKVLLNSGIDLTDQQQKMITTFGETNNKAEAQRKILDLLSGTLNGAARAAGETFTGQMEILKNTLDDVKERIGEKVLPIFNKLATTLTAFVTSDKFKGWIESIIKFFGIVREKFSIVWAAIQDSLVPAFKKLSDALGIASSDGDTLTKVVGFLAGAIKVVIEAFALVITAITKVIETSKKINEAFQGLVDYFVALPGRIRDALWSIGDRIWDAFKAAKDWVINSIRSNIVDPIIDLFDIGQKIKDKLSGAFGGVGDIIGGAIGTIGNIFRASGGPVSANQPYVVGEQGPELFVPRGSGQIVPNSQMGSNVTVNINNPSVRSDADITAIADAVRRAMSREFILKRMGTI